MVAVLRMHLGYGCPQAVVRWHLPLGHTWAGEMGPRETLWPPWRAGLGHAQGRAPEWLNVCPHSDIFGFPDPMDP